MRGGADVRTASVPAPPARLGSAEQPHGDGLGQRGGAGVVGVQVVAAVVAGEQLLGSVRIAQRRVEVDDRVVLAAGADPAVDGLPGGLVLRTVEAEGVALERGDGTAEDLQAAFMGAGDELALAADDVRRGHLLRLGAIVPGCPRSFTPSRTMTYSPPAGRRRHGRSGAAHSCRTSRVRLGVRTRRGVGVVQQAVAADALVDHAERRQAGAARSRRARTVGPAAVRVRRWCWRRR